MNGTVFLPESGKYGDPTPLGDMVESFWDLEAMSGGKYVPCDGRTLTTTELGGQSNLSTLVASVGARYGRSFSTPTPALVWTGQNGMVAGRKPPLWRRTFLTTAGTENGVWAKFCRTADDPRFQGEISGVDAMLAAVAGNRGYLVLADREGDEGTTRKLRVQGGILGGDETWAAPAELYQTDYQAPTGATMPVAMTADGVCYLALLAAGAPDETAEAKTALKLLAINSTNTVSERTVVANGTVTGFFFWRGKLWFRTEEAGEQALDLETGTVAGAEGPAATVLQEGWLPRAGSPDGGVALFLNRVRYDQSGTAPKIVMLDREGDRWTFFIDHGTLLSGVTEATLDYRLVLRENREANNLNTFSRPALWGQMTAGETNTAFYCELVDGVVKLIEAFPDTRLCLDTDHYHVCEDTDDILGGMLCALADGEDGPEVERWSIDLSQQKTPIQAGCYLKILE